MVDLDLRDKKLLFELDFDARKTYSKLSKTLGMSKRGVEYKIQSLEKKGIIKGYYPVIDLSKLGYYYFRVLIKFNNLSANLRKEIEKYVITNKEIGWAFWIYGEYDLGFSIWAKSLTEFQRISSKFYFAFDKYIKTRRESIGTEINFYKHRYLIDSKDLNSVSIGERVSNELKLDEIDSTLLKLLIKKPRSSIIDLAEQIRESPKLVAYRLKRLKAQGIILAIRPSLKHQLLGRTYHKILINFNNTNQDKINQLEKYVASSPLVIYIVKALGLCDFDIELMTESNEQLFQFVEDLQTKFPGMIKEYQTLIFGDTIKAKFLPFDV